MKSKVVFLSMLIALLSPSIMWASEKIRITEHRDEKGKSTFYSTTSEVLTRSPSWDATGNPPLSLGDAITKAKDWMKTKYPSFKAQEVENISLGKIWDQEIKNRWYYTIALQARATIDGVDTDKYFSVILLLDGSIVEPSETE